MGSRFEFNNTKSKNFELFNELSNFTDDTIMTIAIGKAIKACHGDFTNLSSLAINNMKALGHKYPYAGYGGRFNEWLKFKESKPYHSFGNGAAMRVSACGIYGRNVEEVKMLAKKVTEVTHNHPEGLKAAEVLSVCIFMAKTGESKENIFNYASKYYDLDFKLEMIKDFYSFDVTCQGTMPVALNAFFEAVDFEDSIRNAISIGGDSDTIAAITGSVSASFYGIPKVIKSEAINYLDDYLRDQLLKLIDIDTMY